MMCAKGEYQNDWERNANENQNERSHDGSGPVLFKRNTMTAGFDRLAADEVKLRSPQGTLKT